MICYTHSKNIRCDNRKSLIVHLAKNGGERPSTWNKNADERKLAFVFHQYTNPNTFCYDKILDNFIRKTRPDWFFRSDWSKNNRNEFYKNEILKHLPKCQYTPKDQIFDIAQQQRLSKFINHKDKRYDKDFTEQVKQKCPWWFDSDVYTLFDFEKFFLENYRFPRVFKSAYSGKSKSLRREGRLYYWRRDFKRKKMNNKDKRMSIYKALKKTKLPKNLFYIDLRFFNVAMSKLKRVINFYKKNGELPGEDTVLGEWIQSRDRVPKIKLWKEIAKPLIKQSGLPEDIFEQQKGVKI